MSADTWKQQAAERAIALVEDGMTLGLGTGSTAAKFVDLLGARVKQGLKVRCVPTSEATRLQAEKLGIPYRFIAYCPALIPAADLTPVFLQTPELPAWANRVAWSLMPWLVRGSMRHINRKRREIGLDPDRDAFEHLFGAAPVALATDEELGPPPRESRFEVECIGAVGEKCCSAKPGRY